jgi:hypothetical protein
MTTTSESPNTRSEMRLQSPIEQLRLHLSNPRKYPFDELVMNLLRLEALDARDIDLLRELPPRERLAYIRGKVCP